jgi:hypothetical protein
MSAYPEEPPRPRSEEDGYAWPPLLARHLIRQIARQIARDENGAPTIPRQRNSAD